MNNNSSLHHGDWECKYHAVSPVFKDFLTAQLEEKFSKPDIHELHCRIARDYNGPRNLNQLLSYI